LATRFTVSLELDGEITIELLFELRVIDDPNQYGADIWVSAPLSPRFRKTVGAR
jgi:hypothetical protein